MSVTVGTWKSRSKQVILALVIFPLLISCGKQADFRQRFDKAAEREERGNYWQAIGDYRELLRGELATNNRINVLFRLGDSYRKVESYTLSEEAYSTVLRDYHEEIYQELAMGRLVDCYREAGRYHDALRVYPKLIGVTQEDILLASVYFDLGKIRVKLRQKKRAKESFRQAIQKCRAVQREHADSDFASYANQIEDDIRQVMAKLY